MTTDWAVYFQSGQEDAVSYANDDNISVIEITNSDQEYYQNGVVSIFGETTEQRIGNTVKIKIDGTDQFDGYVARKQQEIRGGKKLNSYQIVGKTYDLWRYYTPSNYEPSGLTGVIASSMVSQYATGISGLYCWRSGTTLSESFNLTNTAVGDALVKLIELDGYRFFVDGDSQLHYYEPQTRTHDFTVTESEIVEMTPIEEADEDLVNDVLVIGGSDYSVKDQLSTTYPSSTVVPSGVWVAQRFTAKDHTLSAIKLYLNRTSGDDAPGTLSFEVWENTANLVFEDSFDNDTYIYDHENTETDRYDGGLLTLTRATTSVDLFKETTDATGENDYNDCSRIAFTFSSSTEACIESVSIGARIGTGMAGIEAGVCKMYLYEGKPDGTAVGSQIAETNTIAFGSGTPINGTFYFSGSNRIQLETGTRYCIVIHRDPTPRAGDFQARFDITDNRPSSNGWYYDGSGWNETQHDLQNADIDGCTFNTAGVASSNSYTVTAKYIKATIGASTSSQDIGMSGTNNNWANTYKLTDGEWTVCSAESSDGCALAYYLVGNGDYSPTLTSCKFEASDETGGIEEELFDDDFDDYTVLDESTKTNVTISDEFYGDDRLCLTTSDGDHYAAAFFDLLDNFEDSDVGWADHANLLVDNQGTCATYSFGTSEERSDWFQLSFDNKKYLNGIEIEANADYVQFAQSEFAHITDVQVSGPAYTDGWSTAISNKEYEFADNTDNAEFVTHIFGFDSNRIWSGVKQVKVSVTFSNGTYTAGTLSINYFKMREVSAPLAKGNIKTNIYTLGDFNFDTLKVEPSDYDHGSDNVAYSGTLDAGQASPSWTKLTPDQATTLGTPGTGAQLWICLESYETGDWSDKYRTNPFPQSTYVGGCKLTATRTIGGGKPKSGSKLEWSDDISLTAQDVPYVPNWTNWTTYTDPKLSGLTENKQYWLVMHNNSSNSAYWTYYYNPQSSYDGKISYSWYGPNFKTSWSSNAQLPAVVPEGNMTLQLGWKEGNITATATNDASISLYGRHTKLINDSNLNTTEAAQARADAEVDGMETVPKKGTLTIDGRTDMETYYRMSSNLTNFGIDDIWDVVSYTQKINEQGFTTEINYGKQPFDIVRKIAELEEENR